MNKPAIAAFSWILAMILTALGLVFGTALDWLLAPGFLFNEFVGLKGGPPELSVVYGLTANVVILALINFSVVSLVLSGVLRRRLRGNAK